MSSQYEKAVTTLYQAAPEAFVTERQRLAAELKAGGDKAQAATFAKLARPALSAWAVNQLWWHARADFDELFATAKQLRAGKISASGAHRQAVAKLAARAQRLLSDAGHSANDATLRRVLMTLSGLAAVGGFEPDLPGALAKDREPAGFDAFGAVSGSEDAEQPEAKRAPKVKAAEAAVLSKQDAARQRAHEHQAAEKARREAAALKKREAEERARQVAERREAAAAVHSASATLAKCEGERNHAAKALASAERELEHARAALEKAQQRLAALKDEDER